MKLATRICRRGGDSDWRAGGRKVLVIDDSLMLLSFVKEILAEANYQVVTAADGGGRPRLRGRRDVPDLILLDYVLPDMKGDEVCKHLSQKPATANVRDRLYVGFRHRPEA